MSILSLSFVIFLAAAFLVYFLTPGKYQWIALLVISYVFYLFAGVRAIIFILITTTTTFFAGRWIGKINDEFDVAVANYQGPNPKMTRDEKKALKADEDKRKKRIMILVMVLNFGILLALKFINPIVDVMNGLCGLVGLKYEIPHFSMLVPLGISYYTFQSMGYIIDLYRRKYKPSSHFGHFMLFLSFFPQLVQGPISRYNELSSQLIAPHRFEYTRVKHGMELVVWGLFKKLVISDRIAIIASTVYGSPDNYKGYYIAVAMVISSIQLYTDFSGGIDVMRGVAEAFGIILPENFTRPYFSVNLAEYWRRWHITMNTWWRDYLFYPLSLSRPFQKLGKRTRKIVGDNFSKKLPILLSIIVIRVVNSIWHGATASNVTGGLYHGIILAISLYFEPYIVRLTKRLKINTECFSWRLFQIIRTFILITIPKVFYPISSMSEIGKAISNLVSVHNPWVLFDGSIFKLGVTQPQLQIVSLCILILIIVSCLQEKGYSVRAELDKQNLVFRGAVYLFFIFAIIIFGVYGSAYNASAFAYQFV